MLLSMRMKLSLPKEQPGQSSFVGGLVHLLKATLTCFGSECLLELPLRRGFIPDFDLKKAPDLFGSRVLVLDRGQIRHLPLWFDQLGLQCHRQNSPVDGLCQLGRVNYDFIMIDMSMGGFEFVSKVMEHSGEAHVLVTTRRGERGDARRCLDLGVRAYLTHPLCVEDVFLTFCLLKSQHQGLITRHALREIRNYEN